MTRILIVEDDAAMASGLQYNLERAGYEVSVASDGPSGLELATSWRPELIVLDVMLPGFDGYEFLKRLRPTQPSVPVIVLSALDAEVAKIRGLDSGADDYVTKPFGVGELLARIRVRLSRSTGVASDGATTDSLQVDLDGLQVHRDGETIAITPTEAALLRMLLEAEGKPVDRGDLLREVWGVTRPMSTRTLDTHIARLRRKVESDAAHPQWLLTVHGIGYRLTLDA